MSLQRYGFLSRVLYLMYNFGFNYEVACPTERLLKKLSPLKQLSTYTKKKVEAQVYWKLSPIKLG